ncbi:MAG TPA: Mrp/NBP35 family ATP-binding protein [Chloroflexia bacterium]|nr:Mrp/NBP35 family ATP-binding protein [Chloroflexia bacterium]
MAHELPGVKKVLAVASGKGGVGKTTVTVNLALALALDGAHVGIFDADIYGPNVPLMLGVRRTAPASGMAPIARADNTPYIPPLERYGLRVMSIGLLVGETESVMPDPMHIGLLVTRTLRDVIWGELDYLLVDLPPGTGEPQHTLLRTVHMDGAVVVTTPQDLSLLDAGRSLGLFRKAEVPLVGVVENMSYLICPNCGDKIEVFHRSRRDWAVEDEELELLGRVPMDIDISRGIDAGHPLLEASPEASEAHVFRDIARRVAAKLDWHG